LINILRFSIYYTKHILKDVEPFTILSLIAYVYSMYKGRKNINRKNSPVKKAYDKGIKISVAEPVNETSALDSSIDKNNGFALISLSNHFVYEQRSRQGGHHSFHKSPVEHERVGHQRVYRNKDGSIKKIVNVKPSIINKGKGEGVIYQTRLPK